MSPTYSGVKVCARVCVCVSERKKEDKFAFDVLDLKKIYKRSSFLFFVLIHFVNWKSTNKIIMQLGKERKYWNKRNNVKEHAQKPGHSK